MKVTATITTTAATTVMTAVRERLRPRRRTKAARAAAAVAAIAATMADRVCVIHINVNAETAPTAQASRITRARLGPTLAPAAVPGVESAVPRVTKPSSMKNCPAVLTLGRMGVAQRAELR